MASLLKADLARILKDKLFLIIAIIGVIFAILDPVIIKAAYHAVGVEELEMLASSKQMFFTSFSCTRNIGFILPIFMIAILLKDFTQGTIRNKIICGKSRMKIYLSLLISSAIVIIGSILLYSLITFLTASIFFSYDPSIKFKEDAAYFIESTLMMIVNYVMIVSLVCALCVFLKSTGGAIVLYVAILLFAIAIPPIVDVIIFFAEEDGKEVSIALKLLSQTNVFYNISSYIGTTNEYTLTNRLYMYLSPIISSGLIISISALRMKKQDIK